MRKNLGTDLEDPLQMLHRFAKERKALHIFQVANVLAEERISAAR